MSQRPPRRARTPSRPGFRAPAPEDAERRRRLLVVDDDAVDRQAVVRALRGSPWVVDEAPGAEDALRALEAHGYDVILLDHHLPDATAPEVIDRLSGLGVDVPVVLLTGSRDPEVIAEAMRRGAVDFVAKASLEREQLERTIGTALRIGDAERRLAAAHAASEAQAARLLRKVETSLEVQAATDFETFADRAARAFARTFGTRATVRVFLPDRRLEASAGEGGEGVSSTIPLELPRIELTGEAELATALDDGHERLTAKLLARSVGQSLESLVLLQRAEEAARARRDLSAIVSHDLRTPLQTFALGVKLLGEHVHEPRARELLERMTRHIASMERLIRDILDATRFEDDAFTLTLVEVDVGTIVREVVDEQAPLADLEHIVVSTEVAPAATALGVRADSTRLRQALGNLVSNAIKHTPRAGRVTVRARAVEGRLRFEVQDTGPGVPAEVHDRIFDRLVRGPSGRTLGLGLGLYIARRITEAHGGTVGVVSETGRGSCFWLELPAAPPGPAG